ncbi:MAG TPA: DUF4184 family protein [Longimicrobium sp.]|nr:DUF4184 family protein [Longimicrobium sp.]
MPITPAHAAAAWPLHRAFRRLPVAALVIGTMSPDLEYVLRMRPFGKFGHSPAGLFVFCLPLTVVLWWWWRAAVRPALTPLLPPALRAAAEAPPPGRATDAVPLAMVAALLGAATHILWDGFTHETGWAVALLPAMRQVPFARFPNLPWFALAQYASSCTGALITLAWMVREWRRWPRQARRFAPGQRARLARVALFVAVVSLGVGAVNATLATSLPLRAGRAAVGTIGGVGVALAIYAMWAASLGRVGPQH